MNKVVVVGVCGGIAAYKALDVISALKKSDFEVHVIMTNNAKKFVTELSFQSLSQNLVITDMFQEPKAFEIQHISLAKKADLIVVIPATANLIGKVASGIADDMLSTTIMASKAPVIFAPAMNSNMYENPIVMRNIESLKSFGYEFIDPSFGRLACGDIGRGKLADVNLIVDIIKSKLYDVKDMANKKVLVTAGPTISKIDPVRFITNHSTGKMGYEIAKEARDRGAKVVLISGPSNLAPPVGVEFIKVETTSEMLDATLKEYDNCDIVIKSAAVADYDVKYYSPNKIKKGKADFNLELIKDMDILKTLGEKKKGQILVGFAAESNDVVENAMKKLKDKNLDYIVANDITGEDIGFGSEENKVTIISGNYEEFILEKISKRAVAKEIFNIVLKKRN